LKNQNQITLDSLFDGIGGFPYAGSFFGIKPLWASEILPQAISVTKRHLPEMEHVGDITALDGAKLPPVDIITFGSPCQDLSIAGRRAGLSGERSGLFFEAIRIIQEMRCATNGNYPKIAIFENLTYALQCIINVISCKQL
jgi:DNA (cytosine-5)-methyltransferase 1